MDTCPRCGVAAEVAGTEDARAYFACPKCRRVWAIPIAETAARDRRSASPRLRILIVDDSAEMLHLLECWFEDVDATVVKALSGREALDVAAGFAPHVAFVDLVLPPPDGWRVCEALQHQSRTEVVLITGVCDSAVRARAAEIGVALLAKPFTQEEALDALVHAVARARYRGTETQRVEGPRV